MLSIVKDKEEGIYEYSYYKDDVLITEYGYRNKKENLYWNDDPILVELATVYHEKLEDIKSDIGFYIEESVPGSLFSISSFKYHKGKLRLELVLDDYDSSWKASTYNPIRITECLKRIACPVFTVVERDDYWYNISFYYEKSGFDYFTLGEFIQEGIDKLVGYERAVCLDLSGFYWKREYEYNEKLFSTEVVASLLRRMGFVKILYSHGVDEFGRDFVFSKLDKFGNIVHYAMQVKVGDINGRVNGKIDKLIGQLEDAFMMPVYRGNEPPFFISTFYIAISGKFTVNAIEKLKSKIPRQFVGSVQILDKEKVIELLAKTYF
jgi:hypothetical protein